MTHFDIREDDLSGPKPREQLALHLGGMRRLSLETGNGDAFEGALRLYRERGFQDGKAFADYTGSAFNQFLHLELVSG